MKQPLFYIDQYIKEFTARIEKVATLDGKWHVVLPFIQQAVTCRMMRVY
ncbi:hypothetical protein [Alkalihalobacillus deserti]|nr:hypothetical protein [Alkalihalobacillus deserti]